VNYNRATWQFIVTETIFISVLLLFHLTLNLLLLLLFFFFLSQLLTLSSSLCYTNTVTNCASPYSSGSSAGVLKSQCHVKLNSESILGTGGEQPSQVETSFSDKDISSCSCNQDSCRNQLPEMA